MEGKRQKGRSVCSMCLDLRFELIFETEDLETKIVKKQKQEEGDGIKETDKKADLFVLWKYEINLWLVRSSNKF